MSTNDDVDDQGLRIDPYLRWAVATNFAYLGNTKWYPLLLELDGSVEEFWARVARDDLRDEIQIARVYQTPPREVDKTSFCTVLVNQQTLRSIVAGKTLKKLDELLSRIKRFELCSPVIPSFDPAGTQVQAPEQRGVEEAALVSATTSRRAIVAVIDDGLAFANQRFRDANGNTRFKFFWNQDDTTGIGRPPKPFNWGRELKASEIDQLLIDCTHAGMVDEDAVYKAVKQSLAFRRMRHGTHVMDIACGLDPKKVTSSSPYLIGVQLPRWVTADTSGRLLTSVAMDALRYVLFCADELAGDGDPLPVVVNLSYGKFAGPHDGKDLLEAAIDELIKSRGKRAPFCVVLPAGNHYLSKCHAASKLRPRPKTGYGEPLRLKWRVQPDNRAESLMEIWLQHSKKAQKLAEVKIRVTTPDGTVSPWIGRGDPAWHWPSKAHTRFMAQYSKSLHSGRRSKIYLAMAPTAEVAIVPRTARSGTWCLDIRNEVHRELEVHAWVQRGDSPIGYPTRGRQSRFDDPSYIRFDGAGRLEEQDLGSSPIHRRGTTNALGTGHRAIVIGGFRRSTYTASRYSGAGPVVLPPSTSSWRDGPDAIAVADDSITSHGVLAAGTRTGSVFAMDGTSVAAPQITRLISEWMNAGTPADRAALRVFAAANNVVPSPAPSPSPPFHKERVGEGGVELVPRNKHRWVRY
jgi:hypothetical protein